MFDLIPYRKRSYFPTMWGGFGDVFDRFFGDFPGFGGEGERGFFGGSFLPSLDVSETESEVVVRMEAPGMEAKNFDISIKDHVLWVGGEKKEDVEKEGERYHTRERRYGSFKRSVCLPSDVDEGNVDAGYHDGVLKVTLHKTEEAKKNVKKIKVH